ncbi:MAG: alanine/glycine:cation symporter family protein [Parachlamydiaceae bacterium]
MDLSFQTLLMNFNQALTFFFVFPAIVLLGLYLSIKLRFVQLLKLRLSFSFLLKKESQSKGNISHYQAIATVLAGNFGTGNISGMAVAITTGGPGALVWMWIMAFLGASIQYASCLLGVKYRQQNPQGEYVGGPMYYLRDGLGFKKLAQLFAFFTLVGALVVGNFAQVNSVTLPLEKIGFNPIFCGCLMAVLVGIVLLGGIQRVASIASFIVPLKAFLYLATALIILGFNIDKVIPALKLMFISAFDFKSGIGGVLGFGVVKAISSGFDRGLFATDAGTGIVPILQAGARTSHPVIDGVVTLAAPFLVMIVCTMTGLVLLVTGVWQESSLQSTNMVTEAFQKGLGHSFGAFVVVIALLLFAYTTILAWAYCAEKAIEFLFGTEYAGYFIYLYVALIPLGAMIHVDLIWRLADISISLMLITNLVGVIGLSKEVVRESREFFLRKKELQVN